MKRLWECNSSSRSAVRVAGIPTTAGRAATKRESKELNGQRRRRKERKRRTRRATSCLRRGFLARGTVVVQAELDGSGEAQLQVELDVEV